jgi:UDP-N-acetylglucosamine transferase subunit ALG13
MIFATVGTQLPFDRLLLAVDTWAALHRDVPVIAQTGRTTTTYAHLTCLPHLDQARYNDCVAQARVIVAHAGMGSILSAIEAGKPVILMPRRADLNEHRNDHQRDTAAEMAVLSNVTVVEDSTALCTALSSILAQDTDPATVARSSVASPSLLAAMRDFIWSENSRPNRRRFALRPMVRA